MSPTSRVRVCALHAAPVCLIRSCRAGRPAAPATGTPCAHRPTDRWLAPGPTRPRATGDSAAHAEPPSVNRVRARTVRQLPLHIASTWAQTGTDCPAAGIGQIDTPVTPTAARVSRGHPRAVRSKRLRKTARSRRHLLLQLRKQAVRLPSQFGLELRPRRLRTIGQSRLEPQHDVYSVPRHCRQQRFSGTARRLT